MLHLRKLSTPVLVPILLAFAWAGAMLLLLAGCGLTPPRPHAIPPQTETVILPTTLDRAYLRAYQTFVDLPTAIVLSSDPTVRSFSGELHHAVRMTVSVTAAGEGAAVIIHGSIPPNRMVRGEFTEVQDFARLLEEGR